MKNINNEKYGRLTVLLLITWLALSITASAWSLFHAGSKHAVHPPLPLGLAVIMPVLLFALWFAASPEFRRFALSLNVRTLTIVQSWRIGVTDAGRDVRPRHYDGCHDDIATQPDSDLCRATPDGFTHNLNCSGCTLANRDRNGSPYYSGFSAVGIFQSRGPPWLNGNQLTRQHKSLFVQ